MAIILKQSTQVVVRIGPFVDVGDGFTPETAVALSTADEAELLKAAGAATVSIASNTWAAVTGADGWYDLTLTTTDTNTIGELVVVVHDDSVCLPVFQRFQVVEEAVYDDIFAASADPFTVMQSDVAAIHSQTTVIESDSIVVSSDVAAIHSQTTVIESDVALFETAHAEPTGVPAANETPFDKLGYLFMALRNQVTVTATKKTFFDDGGVAEWEKDLSDDGSTYTETEGNAI